MRWTGRSKCAGCSGTPVGLAALADNVEDAGSRVLDDVDAARRSTRQRVESHNCAGDLRRDGGAARDAAGVGQRARNGARRRVEELGERSDEFAARVNKVGVEVFGH